MMSRMKPRAPVAAAMSLLAFGTIAWMQPAPAASGAAKCPECEQWLKPHKPFRIFGNTYYVGTQGLTSILVTSDFGHVLIDAGLPQSAPLIKANVEALGFKITDVKGILITEEHPEHAGGVAQLQKESGAQVYAMRPAEAVLRTGKLAADDPLADSRATLPTVPLVWILQDNQLLGMGSVRLRAHATPGRAPGGTSWEWESCESGTCLQMFYSGALDAATAGKYRFKDHPEAQHALQSSFQVVESAPCDVLLTSHPDASQLFQRLDTAAGSRPENIKDESGCKRHAQAAREAFSKYLAAER